MIARMYNFHACQGRDSDSIVSQGKQFSRGGHLPFSVNNTLVSTSFLNQAIKTLVIDCNIHNIRIGINLRACGIFSSKLDSDFILLSFVIYIIDSVSTTNRNNSFLNIFYVEEINHPPIVHSNFELLC